MEVRVSLTKKQALGISYEFAGEHYNGTQLGAAYQFGGLQRYQGINYEPERDDEKICTDLGGDHRTTAAAPPAHRRAEPGSPAVAAAEFDLGAAIEQLDFHPTAAAEQIREFGGQSPQVAADAGELGDAIEYFVEREIIESAAPEFERLRESLERNRAAADHAERLRAEIAELARTVALYLEQFQREQEQAELEVEVEWDAIASTTIGNAEQLLATLGKDQPDGSRAVWGQRYGLEQQGTVLTITALYSQSSLFSYDSADQTYISDGNIERVQEMANALEQAVTKMNRQLALAEMIQSFNPEFGESVPALAAIERAQQQVERVTRQIAPLHRQLTELTNELQAPKQQSEQAGPLQRLLDQWADEPRRLEKLQLEQRDLARSILALQSEQRGYQHQVDSGQASRQREEERLKQMYQELAEQVQSKMGLQERRAIDEAVAVVILSSNCSQADRNLEALDFSPAVGQWRRKQSDLPQLNPYVEEIIDAARQQVRELPQTSSRAIVQSEPELEIG